METLTLQAETRRLLDLVIHSLYTQREIFLRELVANGSDALDRFRFESLSRSELITAAAPLEIHLEADPSARTLTVRDNGIGMTRAQVIDHIGTIARSGTQEFQDRVAPTNAQQAIDMIGRFGVGFYSCFMVADKVTLRTRRAGEEHGTEWESCGNVEYTVAEAKDLPRGTSVTLHLKPVDEENGIEDYADRWVLSRIVKRYADFITYPISYVGPARDSSGTSPDVNDGSPVLLNSMKPIWLRRSEEVKPSEYDEFYRHLSNDWSSPSLRLTFRAEGRWEYAALVFVPAHAPYDLYYSASPYGLQLYARRMLIAERSDELLPRYLRFIRGVVDAADLPLNVSRQNLQNAYHLQGIRKWLTKKVLDALAQLGASDESQYALLWREFGRALKEGLSEDHENRDRLIPLLRFPSSFDGEKLTSLADYVSRMKADQSDIYYICGESRTVAERSPHLEGLRSRGYEVMYFVEPVDELLAQALHEYDGHRLRSVNHGQVELGDETERQKAKDVAQEQTAIFESLMTFLAKHLADHLKGVRVSSRLASSAACLVGEEFDFSPHINKLLSASLPRQRRTLELNPSHPMVIQLRERYAQHGADPVVVGAADLLLGAALLAEGSPLPDSASFSHRLTEFSGRVLAGLKGRTATPVETANADAVPL